MSKQTLAPLGHVLLSTDGAETPSLPFYLLSVSKEQQSALSVALLEGFVKRSVGGKAEPMWMLDMQGQIENLNISVLPVGWSGDWHESPKPQWVIPLSGQWFIEAQDGTRVEMGPGDIHWGHDIGTRDGIKGRGHRSGQLGSEPCVIMMVQFSDQALTLPLARPQE